MKDIIYDVAIIGSGASGGAVAYQLCKAGYKVIILEKGRLITRDEFSKDELAYCRRDIVTPSLFEEYHTIEEKIDGKWTETPTYESGWSFWNGNIVGGSSNFMSGMFHRMHPDDFRLKSVYGEVDGANIIDWAISYNDLEPYYRLAEDLVGISGNSKKHKYEAPRSRLKFFQPPTEENNIVHLFDKSCKKLGITPSITARAILSQDIKNRGACYYSNFCGSYGCSSGAKGSSREAFISPALATGNLTLLSNSHVTHLDSNKSTVTRINIINSITKKPKKIYSKIFVLASQAHESVRLLFNSKNNFFPNGLSNSSGELGKNLIFSAGGVGGGTFYRENMNKVDFDNIMERGLFINRSILDWYIRDDWWRAKEKGGLVEFMFEHQNNISRAVNSRYKNNRLIWGDDLAKKLKDKFINSKTLRFEIFNDWLPTDNCYITIDKNRKDKYGMPVGKMRIDGHPKDLDIAFYLLRNVKVLLKEMGAKDIYSSISSTPPQNLIAGGCRFGNNPKTSILDKNCKSHDLDNLFIADASFMPTGGSTPYSWTIYANALRVGDNIIKVLKN
ncbi:MAG: GMC family oxidoreductase [Sulfurovum sp.]|nr:GMC family oxidoreductase [Sulfurovaceae bacterium]